MHTMMKAVGYCQSLPIEHAESLLDLTLPEPVPTERDLLVAVKAVSVNPVDVKMRGRAAPEPGQARVLGWDAAGVVQAVGAGVSLFKPGDRVWYAGSIARPGANSELHVVDERIVGPMPKSLDFAAAAALPLTAITAWELLFERLGVPAGKRASGESLLVVGAGGGVGSILVQLARRLTGLRVIGTAGREATRDWLLTLGAHEVIDHSRPLADELRRIGQSEVTHVASLNQTDRHFAQIVESLVPQGRLALIDDPQPLDVTLLKRKSLSLHWELMFTRSLFQTPDLQAQHRLLADLAALVDDSVIRTTVSEHFGRIDAANLKRAHGLLESGQARGKVVLEGF
jgi:zinc-binding alcohol dehydrogenase family protein